MYSIRTYVHLIHVGSLTFIDKVLVTLRTATLEFYQKQRKRTYEHLNIKHAVNIINIFQIPVDESNDSEVVRRTCL